jgi:PhnB protein
MTSKIQNDKIPTTITPFLTVKNGAEAIDFYVKGLGAIELARYAGTGDKLSARLALEGAEFFLGDEEAEFGNISPHTTGGSPVRIVLTVADPDTIFDRALKAGATQICAVRTEEDWRIGKLQDPFGHIWEIGRPLNKEDI